MHLTRFSLVLVLLQPVSGHSFWSVGMLSLPDYYPKV